MSVTITIRPAASHADRCATPDELLDDVLDGVQGDVESRRRGGVDDANWASATVSRPTSGEVLLVEVHMGAAIAAMYNFEANPALAEATVISIQVAGEASDWSWSEDFVNGAVERLSAVVIS